MRTVEEQIREYGRRKQNEHNRRYYAEHRERILARVNRKHAEHREEYNAYMREYRRRVRAANINKKALTTAATAGQGAEPSANGSKSPRRVGQ